MSKTTHSEIEDLLGAYALDAVEDDERALVEEHLDECARCRAEVAEHRETAALLAYSGADAPSGIWDGIATRLDQPAPVLDISSRRPAPVDSPLAWSPAVAAVAVLLVLVVGALGWKVVDQDREIEGLASRVSRGDLASVAATVLSDPDSRQVELRGADGRKMGVVALSEEGDGYVLASAMQPLEEGRAYQLWALTGAEPVSAGLLGRAPDIAAFHVEGDVEGFAISVEDENGAPAPTSAPVAAGNV